MSGKKILLRNIGDISAVILLVMFVLMRIEQSEKAQWGNPADNRFISTKSILKNNSFTEDEHRIALHFTQDTLPGLIRKGLIKKYNRTDHGTILSVAGRIWKERSDYFKESLLSEIYVHNKVNGYAVRTKIVDEHSGNLFAEILEPNIKRLYD